MFRIKTEQREATNPLYIVATLIKPKKSKKNHKKTKNSPKPLDKQYFLSYNSRPQTQ
jgi:hypothetical protein